MKEASTLVKIAIIVSALAAIGIASSYFFGKDNKVEEACEKLIEVETGLDIDLTPGSTGASE